MIFKRWRQFKQFGILGMNERNARFIQHYNKRAHFPLVDNKLATKDLAMTANIAVPPLYATIAQEHEIAQLATTLEQYQDFVIKPAHGSGGDGILVVTNKRKSFYQKSNGVLIDQETLYHHVSNILSGMYSLGGHLDKAMVEYRVKFDPIFEAISYQGVPDIRMLVFKGFPVMGMVRLPTRLSHGKANLHQGAIGVGINLASGTTTTGVWRNDIVDFHPDTGNDIANIMIPSWEQVLHIAAHCYDLTQLGYLGVDIVLDSDKGPLMLELNARPGLNIQIANQAGLLPRLNAVEALLSSEPEAGNTPEARIAFCTTQF